MGKEGRGTNLLSKSASDLRSSISDTAQHGTGHGNPLWCSCLENPMVRGAWGLQSMGPQRVRHD